MRFNKSSVSIVVPTLNESGSVHALIERIAKPLIEQKIPFEIIILDDHSTDATRDIAMHADDSYHVRVALKEGARGKSFSLIQGFALAKHTLVCMIDADLQYPPEAIVPMYEKLHELNADIILTKRVTQHTPLLRQLSSRIFNFLFVRSLFGIDYDTQSGLKLFRRSVIDRFTLSPSPWSFDLEFIVRALENNLRIFEYDILFAEREFGDTKLRVMSATYELALASVKLRRSISLKKVKQQYKSNLKALQQSTMFFGGIFLAALLTNIALPAPAHALSVVVSAQTYANVPELNSQGASLSVRTTRLAVKTTLIQSTTKTTASPRDNTLLTPTISTIEHPLAWGQRVASNTIPSTGIYIPTQSNVLPESMAYIYSADSLTNSALSRLRALTIFLWGLGLASIVLGLAIFPVKLKRSYRLPHYTNHGIV
jgi:glycosyltransferase involved in cell wall biosynthesis